MASEAMSTERWRKLFGSQVFEALEAAITIAALDDPAGLRRRRDHIMEMLFKTAPAAAAAASPPGIAKNVAVSPVRGGKANKVVVFGKKDDHEPPAPAPAPKALFRAETSAAAPAPSSSRKLADAAAALSTPSVMEAKLAATKRKLQEGYEEAADAKRQRRIHLIAAPEMAKQGRKPVVGISRRTGCVVASMGPERRAMLASSSRLPFCS